MTDRKLSLCIGYVKLASHSAVFARKTRKNLSLHFSFSDWSVAPVSDALSLHIFAQSLLLDPILITHSMTECDGKLRALVVGATGAVGV
jgi:hypothetical protein